MDIQKLPASRGLAWFKQAIDLGAHNPRGVFGAAMLVIVAFYLAMLLAVLPMAALATEPPAEAELGAMMARVLPMVALMLVVVSLLLPFMVGGLMHVIRETEAGRKPGALAVFAPFRSGRGPRLAAIGFIVLGAQVAGGMLVMAIGGGDYMRDYMEMMRGLMAGADPTTITQPDTPLLMFLLQLAVNYFGYVILLFSVPLVLFMGSGLGEAVRGSLQAAVRNIGANLLAAVLLVLGAIVATLLFVLVLMLVTLVAKAIHSVLASLLGVALALLFGSGLLVVLVGAAYLAWRDTFEGGDAAGGTNDDVAGGIEA